MICKNCNRGLRDTQNYCDNCGAKVLRNRLTPNVLAQQVNEQVFSLDNKLLKTFVDLFIRPEQVIVGYINGARKRYIDVIQYFLIALSLAGIQFFLTTTFFEDSLELNLGFAESLANSKSQENNPFLNSDTDEFESLQNISYIIAVPFSALATWLVYTFFGNKRYNYTEHLVINLYYSAQIIILSAIGSMLFLLLGINYFLIALILTVPMFIYLGFVLYRIFDEDLWVSLGKFILTIGLYLIFYVIIAVIIGIVMAVSTFYQGT